MTPPRRKGTFSTVGTTQPSAEWSSQPEVQAEPMPAPVPVQPAAPASEPAMSDFPSKEARNIGHPPAVDLGSIGDLIAGRVDPDLDLVTVSFAIPRYLKEALRLTYVTTRRPQQNIVADALRATLPGQYVAACRDKALRD